MQAYTCLHFKCLSAFKILVFQECAGEDLTDLYLQEKQEQLKTAANAKLKYQMTVPGILNPHEVTEEMND